MTALETVHAIELRNITKRFGKVVANDAVDLTLDRGEILALLGENGSGKTTLMNMLSGIYFPDEGEILVEGKPVSIRSPKDAYDNGIGMIHQHFKLVDVLSAADNIWMGAEKAGALLRRESETLRDAVARAPLDRLLVETDSPYVLPDVPWTGSKKSLSRVRNSSLLLPRVVEEIARLKHLPPETAEAAILENTRRVFHLSGTENGG